MSGLIAQYEAFLVENVSTISTVESSLRTLTWFLPGRFKDGELASEALAATLNVTSLYHDTLLEKVARDDPRYKPLLPSTPHTRYTRAWASRVDGYKWAARMLEVIKFTQLFVEMGLRRNVKPKAKWRFVVLLETIKAILRLLILRTTRRPLASPPIPEREFDPSALPETSSVSSSPTLAPSSAPGSPPRTPDHLRNNHIPLSHQPHQSLHPLLTPPPPMQAPTPVEDFLLPKALTTADVRSPLALIKPFMGLSDLSSEIMYILRPLVYAILLSINPRKSTRPLTAIIIMELVSRHFRRTPSSTSTLERSEYARRDRDIMWYLLRGPIWDDFTRPKLASFSSRLASIPILGVVGLVVQDWMPLIDQYHYYTAP